MEIFNRKYYKFFAIVPGWILGDWIGALSSYLLVNELIVSKEEEVDYEIALLKLSSLLIKSDGNIDREEIKTVTNYFINAYGEKKARRLFRELKKRTDVPNEIEVLAELIKTKLSSNKQYSIIQFLYSISVADGSITPNEDDIITRVALVFDFSKERLNSIRNQFVRAKQRQESKTYSSKVIECLNILGLKPGVDQVKIKSAYRNLAKEFHPDKLSGMNQVFIDLAKQKFQEIQDAYEYLTKNYV